MPISYGLPPTDQASFIFDLTLPDGAVVSPGQALVKTWRVRNTGTSTWGPGYQLAFIGGEHMGAPGAVDVPSTGPDQEVDLSINLIAPAASGEHIGYWQLRNPNGTYFGDKLWVRINVQPPGGHITTLTADPPSPSDANTVRIHARVENFPNFRAMRLKIDGQVVYELGAPEFYYDWNTTGYAVGDHSIVVEVADQTDISWSRPERRGMTYTLEGTSGAPNHAPDRPTLVSPHDWYVYYSGNTAQLCAQAAGDPDGDPVTAYYFDIYESAQLWNSGWVDTNCVTTDALEPYGYQWRVKVRDGRGAESEWSDTWHFTIVNPDLEITEFYFEPLDPDSEQVRIRACTQGQGGVGITMRVSVNDASDGTDSGQWHILKELGVPCFNEIDAPVWSTLDYGDGPHLVRVEAHGWQTGWEGAAVEEKVYVLPHRRPASTRLVAPVPPSGDIRDPVYLNSRTVTFRWEPTLRAQIYTLHVSTSPSPKDDPNPIFRQTSGADITEYTVTFDQDYSTLYWQVSADNDKGTNASGDQLFGLDPALPTCTVQSLPTTTFESVFQVSWEGTDDPAGIYTYDVQYRDSERGVWRDWLTGVPASKTYELFIGQPGHTYAFRCRATDNAGNTGDYPTEPDTSTTVDLNAWASEPWWDDAYGIRRHVIILNNMSDIPLPVGYPIHLHFDGNTTPTAAEIYDASQSTPKCDDLRIVYDNGTELDRVVENCSPDAIDIFFRTQVAIPPGGSDGTRHQLYYGNANPGPPPADINNVFYPPADQNTVGLWHLEGNADDSSGHGHDGEWLGGADWVEGKFGQAIGLPGGPISQGGIRVPSDDSLRVWSFTIEAFVKRAQAHDACGGFIASQGESGQEQERWHMGIEGDKLRLQIWNSGDERSDFGAIPVDTNWHHVAATFDNDTHEFRFYRDGALVYQGQMSGEAFVAGDPTLYMGSLFPYASGEFESFCGAIDGVRLSDIVRTSFPYGAFTAITEEPTAAVGAETGPSGADSPDLDVLSMIPYPNPEGGVLVQTIAWNTGLGDTRNGFYADLYLNHEPTEPGDYSNSIRLWVNDPIPAGAGVTLTAVITDLLSLGGRLLRPVEVITETTATVYIQVDSTGVVSEPSDFNNIYSTEICIAGSDAYESDDESDAAKPISLDEAQARNFDRMGDQDWVTFTAQGLVEYIIETTDLGPAADTYLYLYDTDATTLLAANDDYGGSLASRIEWTAPVTGTYYLLVKHWSPSAGGCGTGYTLRLTRPSAPIGGRTEPPGLLWPPVVGLLLAGTVTAGFIAVLALKRRRARP